MAKSPTFCAKAVAHANIALAKYWGKADIERNLPATPSLSLTLDALSTETRVEFHRELHGDQAVLNGEELSGRELVRIQALLDRLRERASVRLFARVVSQNNFPTASGLASSASGFAALALAAATALDLGLSPKEVSSFARLGSASAARSLFGGYVALPLGAEHAHQVLPPEEFALNLLVCIVSTGRKPKTSTHAMMHCKDTSPYYRAWVENAPSVYQRVHDAICQKDFEALGPAVEESSFQMHACMLASRPPLNYFEPATVAVLRRVAALREGGLLAFSTMDAGPQVKVLCQPHNTLRLKRELEAVPGVLSVALCRPGPDATATTEIS